MKNKTEKESILENKLMISYKLELIEFLNTHSEYFEEAIELAVSEKQPYAWRSAFLLESCIAENDLRIKKYVPLILKSISGKKDGHQRELLKILYKMRLNDKQLGQLLDLCLDLWEQINKAPSIRVTAFKFIIKIAEQHPELQNEIEVLTQEHYLKTLSPGIRNSIERIISKGLSSKLRGSF